MNFPLNLRIQVFSLSAKIEAVDALHQPVCFVRKRRFKFREHVIVFSNPSSPKPRGEIKEDSKSGAPLRYTFTDALGKHLGAITRVSAPPPDSPRPALFLVQDESGQPAFEIVPKNPQTRKIDRILARVPVVRLFSSLLFRPAFRLVSPSPAQNELFLLRKRATPLESRFQLQKSRDAPPLSPSEETRLLFAVLMTVFLEG